jgi:hypothetical protein
MIRLNCFFQATDAAKFTEALEAAKALTEKSLTHRKFVTFVCNLLKKFFNELLHSSFLFYTFVANNS